MKEGNADLIIALVHLGLDEASEDTSRKIAENVEGIDLIVDATAIRLLEGGLQVGGSLISSRPGSIQKTWVLSKLSLKEGEVIIYKCRVVYQRPGGGPAGR